MSPRGYFSLLRWRPEVARDEARNVAILLVEADGAFGAIRSAPLSSVSRRLHDQGLIDAVLLDLEKQFSAEKKLDLSNLHELHETLQHSLYLTQPKPTAVLDVDATVNALYRAYVAPRGGGGKVLTKGKALDRVVQALRRRGLEVKRGHYLDDFIFDVVLVQDDGPSTMEVLSFATAARNWVPVEHDAGHYLYALRQVGLAGMAVVQPPGDVSHENAITSHDRVVRWFDSAGIKIVAPEDLEEPRLPLGV